MNLSESLKTLARELDADPSVFIYAWLEPSKGVTDKELASAEGRLEATLPDPLRSFYQSMNGFGLVWVHEEDFEDARENLRLGKRPFKASRTLHRKKASYPWTKGTDEQRFDIHAEVSRIDHRDTGHIRIPPLKHLVKDPVFSQFVKSVAEVKPPVECSFDGQTVSLPKIFQRFHVLDRFSATEQVFLYVGPGERRLRAHRMTNSFELDDTDPHVDVATYFETVLQARGRRDARRPLFTRSD